MQDKNIELEKTRTQKSRAADTVERVGMLFENGVSIKTIASQLTDNRRDGQAYTAENVEGMIMAWNDAKTSVGITVDQTNALLLDQTYSDLNIAFSKAQNNTQSDLNDYDDYYLDTDESDESVE